MCEQGISHAVTSLAVFYRPQTGYVFTGVCLSTGGGGVSVSIRGVSVPRGLCPGGISVQGLSVQRGFLSRGVSLSIGGFSVRETPSTVTSGRYASYWNSFLLF